MKQKLDFVTNSSSTSFVVVCKEDISAEEFVNHLWDNGLGDVIKNQLVSNIRNGFQKGVNEIYASSEDYDNLFSFIFYNFEGFWWNKTLGNEKFLMQQGCKDTFIDERIENDDGLINEFPPDFKPMIEDYIKNNLGK